MEIEGRIVYVGKLKMTKTKSGSDFVSRDFILEYEKNGYNKKLCFSILGEKNNQSVIPNNGEEVRVHFDIESRAWNEKWYTQLSCWKIEYLNSSKIVKPSTTEKKEVKKAKESVQKFDSIEDLPF